MSNRFHNKWHRNNHHTYPTTDQVDSSYDPIASQANPFKGDFVLAGALSASAPVSAYAGLFISNNTALCAIGGTTGIIASGGTYGIYVRGVSQDTGNIMISTSQLDPVFPDVSKPAIYANGSIVVTKAISANSIWATQLYSVSSITQVTDMSITELSGFKIIGTDFSKDIPATFDSSTQQGLLLTGIGLSGSSWCAFGGDIQTHRDLRVDNNAYLSGNATILQNLNVSGYGSIEDGLTITNGDLYVSGDITEQNGNSNEWNSVYTSVNTTSADWNSVYTSVNTTSADWDSVYTSVNTTSADWDSVYTSVNTTSASWDSTYTTVNTISANWNSVYTSVNNTSAIWDSVNTTVNATSAVWNGGFCNNVVYLNQVSACSNNMTISGDITFASSTSAVTFTNRVSETITNPLSAGWLIVNVAGKDRAILLYNFD